MRIFKFKIAESVQGIKGISVGNEKINAGLFNLLNKACHEALNRFLGKLDWYDSFVHFEKDGKKYEQIKSENLCNGCVFNQLGTCNHPHFETKPYCEGKIYIEKQ